jgi:Zn-dependent protease with chaperone function
MLTQLLALAWHFLLVFLARHWIVGIVNGGVTLLLGLTLLRATRRLFSPLRVLQLRHLVLLVSFYKGVLYLVLGDSLHAYARPMLVWGVQMPDPIEALYVTRQSRDSIWHPATAAEWVVTLMVGLTLVTLLRRAQDMLRSKRALASYLRLGGVAPAPRHTAALRRAATCIGLPTGQPLPRLILAEISHPTPLLLGVFHPHILLAPSLAGSLSEAELEMAFRHELAHLRRRDHWRHWLLTWVGNVGRLNPLTRWLEAMASHTEEEICDRMAVRCCQDAQALAGAIFKSFTACPTQAGCPAGVEARPAVAAVPALVGRSWRQRGAPFVLRMRLKHLLSLANELAEEGRIEASCAGPPPNPGRTAPNRAAAAFRWRDAMGLFARALFWLFLFVILYLKYHFTPDIN